MYQEDIYTALAAETTVSNAPVDAKNGIQTGLSQRHSRSPDFLHFKCNSALSCLMRVGFRSPLPGSVTMLLL